MKNLPTWMTSPAVGCLTALGLLLSTHAATAGDPPARPSTDTAAVPAFSQFQIIAQRNIFDPDRGIASTNRPAIARRPSRVETFSFRGAAEVEGKGYDGFFAGDGAPASGVVDVNDKINGFTVQELNLDAVKLLDADHHVVTLEDQTGLTRRDGGPWTKIAAPAFQTSNRNKL